MLGCRWGSGTSPTINTNTRQQACMQISINRTWRMLSRSKYSGGRKSCRVLATCINVRGC